jgi:hypothetical protein
MIPGACRGFFLSIPHKFLLGNNYRPFIFCSAYPHGDEVKLVVELIDIIVRILPLKLHDHFGPAGLGYQVNNMLRVAGIIGNCA